MARSHSRRKGQSRGGEEELEEADGVDAVDCEDADAAGAERGAGVRRTGTRYSRDGHRIRRHGETQRHAQITSECVLSV